MIYKGFKFGMLLQIAVGPICLLIFQTAVSSGLLVATTGVLGVTIVDSLYILAAILGIGTILNKYPKAKNIFRYFGSVILIIFGISTISGVLGFSFIPSLSFGNSQSIQSLFMKTMLLTLSNPLTILFWAGVFSTKIIEENMDRSAMYLFSFGAILSTVLFLTSIAFIGSLANTFLSISVINVLNILVGIMLIIFGIRTTLKKSNL